jgi:hypothetical protein
MIMTYWAQKLRRPELDHDVPEIVSAIYDAKWKGAGNRPFNAALSGASTGLILRRPANHAITSRVSARPGQNGIAELL